MNLDQVEIKKIFNSYIRKLCAEIKLYVNREKLSTEIMESLLKNDHLNYYDNKSHLEEKIMSIKIIPIKLSKYGLLLQQSGATIRFQECRSIGQFKFWDEILPKINIVL